MTPAARDVQQAQWVRTKFNALYATAHPAPPSPDDATAQAKKILLKLRPDDQSRESDDIFSALDEEIHRAEPGSERLEQVAIAFAVR